MKTKYHSSNAQVVMLKGLHRLRLEDIGAIVGIQPTSVAKWFLDPDNPHYRKAPYEAVLLLKKKYSLEVDLLDERKTYGLDRENP